MEAGPVRVRGGGRAEERIWRLSLRAQLLPGPGGGAQVQLGQVGLGGPGHTAQAIVSTQEEQCNKAFTKIFRRQSFHPAWPLGPSGKE